MCSAEGRGFGTREVVWSTQGRRASVVRGIESGCTTRQGVSLGPVRTESTGAYLAPPALCPWIWGRMKHTMSKVLGGVCS